MEYICAIPCTMAFGPWADPIQDLGGYDGPEINPHSVLTATNSEARGANHSVDRQLASLASNHRSTRPRSVVINAQGRESRGSGFETCSGVWYPRRRPCGVAIDPVVVLNQKLAGESPSFYTGPVPAAPIGSRAGRDSDSARRRV